MNGVLLEDYDGLLFDLDGTVYRGEEPLPSAAEVVRAAREHGRAVRFVTNNASRRPAEVADHLNELDLNTGPDEVSTSAQAGAALLAERVPAGSKVLVLGAEGLVEEVRLVGLTPVRSADEKPVGVVQGLSKTLGWPEFAEATLAIQAGALWVACNLDLVLPTERGMLPGNGALVAAVRAATGAEPLVAGKPAATQLNQAAASAELSKPLVVGDRLDTDIEGAATAGMDSLLVLTGVATPASLLAAPAHQRPRYVSAGLEGLLAPTADSEISGPSGWKSTVDGSRLVLAHDGGSEHDLSALRSLCAAWWENGSGTPKVVAADHAAEAALRRLALD
ncbi:HAD-IIA family hydrolase [Allokutzneria multivorans]|uniref:HAD-IIA family hydrolase n=1 Tax=Allokutzneria multivorans TaxID=1142134 RepID=UPI0031F05CF8